MEDTTKLVTIPTFVHPHLFWLIESNSDRVKVLNNINKLFQNEFKSSESSIDSFEVGDIVAVCINNKYYRAIIEDINNTEIQKNVVSFLCWLIDYGIMYESNAVHKLPSSLKKATPLAVQASLNDVVYVRQNLTYDHKSGLPVKVNEPILTPSSIAHQVSLELMSNLGDLQFKVENKVDGIFLGDILYKENDQLKSLRQTLIERGVLIVEEILFKEILENIHSYKESHLWHIAHICKNFNSIDFLKGIEGNFCSEKIISKYLAEFEDSDLFEDSELHSFNSSRSRSRHAGNNSANSLNSTNESISDSDTANESKSPNGLKGKSPGHSRAKLLLEKLKTRQRDSEKKDTFDDDLSSNNNSNDKENDYPCYPAEEQPTISRIKENIISDYKDKSDTESNLDKKSTPPKRTFPKNVVFVPGGASFTLAKKKTVTCKYKNRTSLCKPSSDVSGDETVDTNEGVKDADSISEKTSTTEDDKKTSTSDDEKKTATEDDDKSSLTNRETGQVKQLKIKPYCSCNQCEHWTNDKDWQLDTHFFDESVEPRNLTINKPQPLFVTEQNPVPDRTIISLDYSSKTKLQKQATFKVLVHGEYSQTPVHLLSEVYFHDAIRHSLRQLKYREAKRIQMYTWPAILRQQHVLMISGSQTGKTMAYLPVILTFLLEKNERYEPFASKTGGPIAVVLCANTKKCEEIYDLSRTLLGRNRLKIYLMTYPLTHVKVKHVDLLVTTPTILFDLLKMRAINFKRLCHLILEDGDKILKLESEILNKVFDLTQSMLCNRIYPKPVQLVICAEHWTLRLENLAQKLNKVPLICIGNYLEAALYGKTRFSMKFVNSACKEHELKNLLKDTYRICKSIILCNKEEIEEVQTILMLKGIEAVVISEDLNKEDNIVYSENVWTKCKGGEYMVLVCTDFILNTFLTVTSATLLIHYSLPHSWTLFVKRFGCLLENCKSPLDKKESKIKCQSVVLCDEKSEKHMFRFFNYINNTELKNQLPDKFKNFSESLRSIEEQDKLKDRVGLCGTLKLFGTCSTPLCPWRHTVEKDSDLAAYLPQSGKIKFKIKHIHDVTIYSVQLIQHIDMEGVVREFNDDSDITEELTKVVKISRKQVVNPIVGRQYVYYDMDELEGVYYRCDLLEIETDCVKIKLIDKGDVIKTVKNRIFRLPKEFYNKPRKIIEVYLANFTPPYRDENFSAKSFFNLKNLLEKNDFKNMVLTADIHLQVGHTLYLKNVFEEVVLSDKIVPRFQLTREILVSKLAEYSNTQLNSLYKLCKEAEIALPVYEKPLKKHLKEEKKIEPQWAHLSMDVNEVTFSAAISPDEIYVRLNKFNQQLYRLQKEIQESLKKPHYPTLANVEIGTICLAKDPEGADYARVIVRNTEENKALCFFVDFGDEAVVEINELKYIQKRFITTLPFQSIQCGLHGIKPVLNDWQDDINNILYEYATEPNSDVFRLLFVKVCSKAKNEVHPKQNRYSVLVKDGFGEKHVLINNLLIDCGVAVSNSEEIEDFEISSNSFNSDESDEELEQILDIYQKTKEAEENVYVNGNEDETGDKDELNDDMELFLVNAEEFFRSLLIGNKENKPQTRGELPAIQAAPAVDYYTPEVYWSQTEKCVKIDIRLPDVTEYVLNLTKGTIMHFKTVKDQKTYKLNIMLYQKVSCVQHTSMGPQVRATLTKVNNDEWPRLTLSKQRARNIHYDVSKINVKEDNTRKILEFPDLSDDDESDENIDVMYHVVSDIDSDFDADLPEDSD